MPCSLKDWIPGMEQRPAGAHPSTLGCRVPSRKDMGHGWSMSLRKSVFILFHHLTCCCVLKCHTNIRLTALHSQPKKKKEVQLPVCGYCGYMQQLESTENQTLMFCWFWLDWRVIFFFWGEGWTCKLLHVDIITSNFEVFLISRLLQHRHQKTTLKSIAA